MKAKELLSEIKDNIKDYDIALLEENIKKDGVNPISKQVSAYNIENYKEIFSLNIEEGSNQNIEVSDKLINDIKDEIAKFFDGCSPESKDIFKNFITYICIYLSLIAKKPLHPVGMDFVNGKTVFKEGNNYYCDVKRELRMKSKDYYTCKYCICKEVE